MLNARPSWREILAIIFADDGDPLLFVVSDNVLMPLPVAKARREEEAG